jgi:hypothetical protein
LAQLFIKRGGGAVRHSDISKEYSSIVSGVVKYIFDDREVVASAEEALVVSPTCSTRSLLWKTL